MKGLRFRRGESEHSRYEKHQDNRDSENPMRFALLSCETRISLQFPIFITAKDVRPLLLLQSSRCADKTGSSKTAWSPRTMSWATIRASAIRSAISQHVLTKIKTEASDDLPRAILLDLIDFHSGTLAFSSKMAAQTRAVAYEA
jgi:hypothetical protein